MIFYSTTDPNHRATLYEATVRAQAPDGGLYMPLHMPRIPDALFRHLSEFSLHDIAYIVTNQLFGGDIDSATLQSLVNETLNFEIPVSRIDDRVWSLELYHGPSGSFKDVGVRFLARILNHYNADDTINLLVATAGPAVETIVRAFGDMPGIRVFLLYPSSRTNRIGFSHLGCKSTNIMPVEVDGSFDDCHAMISEAFADVTLREQMALSSANSLNITRLLPQTLYYFWAYAQLCRDGLQGRQLKISIPSGNLGNLCAGIMAKKMGVPINRFIAAENSNSPFNRYLATGIPTDTIATSTIAGALDVGHPSNLPRVMHLYDNDLDRIKADITGAVVSDDAIKATISDMYTRYNYIVDPHSAVACRALYDNLADDECGIFLSTAAPEKSFDTVTKLIGSDCGLKPRLSNDISDIKPPLINATYPALKKFLLTV